MIDAKHVPFLLVLFLSTLVSAGYYLRILRAAFFDSGQEDPAPQAKDPRRLIVAPLVVTAALSLVIGIYPSLVLELVDEALP